MRLARALAGCALLATLVLLSSDGVLSQEKQGKEGAKTKGQLPQGWGKLDLTAVQKDEIYKLNREYKDKTDKLSNEIKKLNDELAKKRVAVLTDEQRKKLIDLVAGDPTDKPKEKDGSKEKAKAKEPDKQ
jgi:Spy/CpxP family protein refolding chaperone